MQKIKFKKYSPIIGSLVLFACNGSTTTEKNSSVNIEVPEVTKIDQSYFIKINNQTNNAYNLDKLNSIYTYLQNNPNIPIKIIRDTCYDNNKNNQIMPHSNCNIEIQQTKNINKVDFLYFKTKIGNNIIPSEIILGEVPHGNYIGLCKNIQYNKTNQTISANCLKSNPNTGLFESIEINNFSYKDCDKLFINNDGRLECKNNNLKSLSLENEISNKTKLLNSAGSEYKNFNIEINSNSNKYLSFDISNSYITTSGATIYTPPQAASISGIPYYNSINSTIDNNLNFLCSAANGEFAQYPANPPKSKDPFPFISGTVDSTHNDFSIGGNYSSSNLACSSYPQTLYTNNNGGYLGSYPYYVIVISSIDFYDEQGTPNTCQFYSNLGYLFGNENEFKNSEFAYNLASMSGSPYGNYYPILETSSIETWFNCNGQLYSNLQKDMQIGTQIVGDGNPSIGGVQLAAPGTTHFPVIAASLTNDTNINLNIPANAFTITYCQNNRPWSEFGYIFGEAAEMIFTAFQAPDGKGGLGSFKDAFEDFPSNLMTSTSIVASVMPDMSVDTAFPWQSSNYNNINYTCTNGLAPTTISSTGTSTVISPGETVQVIPALVLDNFDYMVNVSFENPATSEKMNLQQPYAPTIANSGFHNVLFTYNGLSVSMISSANIGTGTVNNLK